MWYYALVFFARGDFTQANKHRYLKLPVLILLILLVCIADSKYRLSCSSYTVTSERLPHSFDGYRIVQLSDLHMREFGKDNCRLVKKVAALKPDCIALTGDYIEQEKDISITSKLIQQLITIAPVYFVSGNHDWASGAIRPLKKAVSNNGGIYLSNTYLSLTKNGESIILVGVEDPNSLADMIKPDELLEKVNQKYPNSFVLLLAHRNDYVRLYPKLPCDLILTGHGHGGVVRLPFVGGVFSHDGTLFPEYDAGIFQCNRYSMIVSRGLGPSPPLPRLFNPPEIVAVTLRSA